MIAFDGKMPLSCMSCLFIRQGNTRCRLDRNIKFNGTERPKDCPLKEVNVSKE